MDGPSLGGPGTMQAPARNLALDGLRGVAVLAVIAYHLWPQALPGGFLGVDLFFVLSGYLITGGLLGRLEAGKSVGLSGFWVRRARRLVPAMLFMLVGATALAILAGSGIPAGLRGQWLGALTYTSNWMQIASGTSYFAAAEPPYFQHLWSLAIEEQFYLLWPVVLVVMVVLLRTRRKLMVAVATLAVASATTMAVAFEFGKDASPLYFGTWTHGFGLLVGAAAAIHAASAAPSGGPLPRAGRAGNLTTGLMLGLMLAAMALLPANAAVAYRGGMFVFCLLAAGVIVQLERSRTLASAALSQRYLRWMGNRSYGLYLWHWPLVVLAGALFPPAAATAGALCVLAATFLAAEASWHLVERPVMRDGFRLTLRTWRMLTLERLELLCSGTPGRYAQILPLAALLVVPLCTVTALLASPAQSSLQQQLTQAQTMLDEQPAPPEPAPLTTTGKRPKGLHATGHEVTAVGDSVMLASTGELLRVLPGIDITASVGAQLREAPQVLERLRASNRLRRVVVLGLGTNGDMPAGTLDAVREAIGPDRELLLVTVHASRDWTGAVNEKFRKDAAKYPNVHLADWEHRAGKVNDFARDGIHPGPSGAREYTRMLTQALAGS